MTRFKIGQKFWDERNCEEIEIIYCNESDYYCKILEADYWERRQWFKASELSGVKQVKK